MRLRKPRHKPSAPPHTGDIAPDWRDRANDGRLHLNLGQRCRLQGHSQEALEHLNEALAISSEIGDRATEALARHELGALYRSLGRFDEALEHLRGALSMALDIGDRPAEGAIRNSLALLLRDMTRFEEALSHLEEALTIARDVGHMAGEGATLNNLGLVSRSMGRYTDALDYYQRSLPLSREAGDLRGEGLALNNLGRLCFEHLARHAEAIGYYEQALDLFRRSGQRGPEGQVLSNWAFVTETLGDRGRALELYEEALAIAREVGNRTDQATTLGGLASVFESLGRSEDALDAYTEARGIAGAIGDRAGEVVTLANLGSFHASEHRTPEALECYAEAIDLTESLLGQIMGEELRISYFATVNHLYEAYLTLLHEEGQDEVALHAAERGRARSFVELLAEAQAEVREGVEPVLRDEQQRLLAELSALRPRLAEAHSQPEDRRDPQAIAGLGRQIQQGELRLHTLEARIRATNPRYAALTQLTAWTLDDIQERLLDEGTALLEYVLSERGSLLFCVLRDDFEVFELPPREVIEQQVRELRVAVLHGLRAYPHGHELYEALIAPAAHLIEGKDLLICADGALHYLPFALLLTEEPGAGGEGGEGGDGGIEPGPERSAVAGSEPELLAEVKAALGTRFDYVKLPYLVHRHAMSYAPSATVAGLVREEARERERSYDAELAGFADPRSLSAGAGEVELEAALTHTRDRLKPLPKTADEVWGLAELVSGTAASSGRPERYDYPPVNPRISLRTAGEATKAEVEALTSAEEGRRFRFFHIASHGLLDPEKPQFSGLVFSPGPRGDPFWRTFEIFNARVPSELVVLSACETGLGKLVSGEGIVGLTRAFLYAGAPTVCVSLWKVADESSPELMRAFYEAIVGGQPKARALQAAQRRLVQERLYAHPYWWAPFVVVGEGRI